MRVGLVLAVFETNVIANHRSTKKVIRMPETLGESLRKELLERL